ncbi:MAG: hypothetical protein WD358_07565 [Nitriliruptoraceae bacterium]
MNRIVRAFCPVAGSPQHVEHAFLMEPRRWVPSAGSQGSEAQLDDGLQVVVRAGALSRHVRLGMGKPWRNGSTIWRSLQWDPVAGDGAATTIDRWLPSLDGELGLNRRRPSDQLTLVLDARYLPPGGSLGSAIDTAVLGRLAQTTVERFLVNIAARLTAESMLVNPSDLGEASTTPSTSRCG